MRGVNVRVVDANSKTPFKVRVKPGEVGDVVVSGSELLFGGYDERDAGAGCWCSVAGDTDGTRWLKTGDMGRVDEAGWLYITGRAKDVILRGGAHSEAIRGPTLSPSAPRSRLSPTCIVVQVK